MEKIFTFTLILYFYLIQSCASNATIESQYVEDEDVYQNYSVVHNQSKEETWLTAQFRAGGVLEPTIKLSQNEEISVNGTLMKYVDGDKINLVAETISWIFLNPIFNLLKTGTFYSLVIQGSNDLPNPIEFTFIDKSGSATVIEANLPEVRKVEAGASWIEESNIYIPIIVSGNVEEYSVSCEIRGKNSDDSNYKHIASDYRATARQCEFKMSYEELEDLKTVDNILLSVRFSSSESVYDAQGRRVRLSTAWEEMVLVEI